MADFFEARDSQSRAKHAVLRRYAGGWAGIICGGIFRRWSGSFASAPKFGLHLVYVDGFAGKGRYARDADEAHSGTSGEPIWGSPIIGIRALEGQADAFGLGGCRSW